MKSFTFVVVLATLVSANAKVGDPETPGVFSTPERPSGDVYFIETFNYPEEFEEKWVKSEAKKEGVDENIAKYDGEWSIEAPAVGGFPEDRGLVMKVGGKHYAIAAMLEKPFVFKGKESFIVQYEVNFQEGMSCGGAYIKLLSADDKLDLKGFHDKVPYTIMFGPDRCGSDAKLHLIFRHKNLITGEFEEKHAKRTSDLKFFDDKRTHLFTLILRNDNTYSILVDQFSVNDGNLLEDFTPPVNPDKEIDDPDDKKPEDWDDNPKIPEPNATKPDDWDEDAPAKINDPDAVKPEGWLDDGEEYIPDPESVKPEDWDDEEDGDWEPPMIPNPVCEEVGCGEWKPPLIPNPEYKGKWSPPMIENPNYKGEWKPRRIPNPNHFEDSEPFLTMTPIAAVGFELWTVSGGVYFDNMLITSELTVANNFAYDGWVKKFEKAKGEEKSQLPEWLDQFLSYANDYPFLWFVYIVVLVSPCVLLACCCVRSKPPSPSEEAAKRKKTDEPSPDVPPEEEPDVGEPKVKEEESFVAEEEQEGGSKEGKEEEVEITEEEEEEGEEEEEEGEEEEKDKEEEGDEDEEEIPSRKESPKRQTRRRKKAGT